MFILVGTRLGLVASVHGLFVDIALAKTILKVWFV